jgi:hypothetical protein
MAEFVINSEELSSVKGKVVVVTGTDGRLVSLSVLGGLC